MMRCESFTFSWRKAVDFLESGRETTSQRGRLVHDSKTS